MKSKISESDHEIADTMIYIARTVEAAPKLIAALKMALDDPDSIVLGEKWEQMALAAIAKATGHE